MGFLAEQRERMRFERAARRRFASAKLAPHKSGLYAVQSGRRSGLVVITGDKQVDHRLSLLIPKAQRRIVRDATRTAAKQVVLPEAKRNVINTSWDTGVWHDSLTVRAKKRSRRTIGHSVVTRRPRDSFDDDPWYFKFPELGSKHQRAEAPMRKAIYETYKETRDVFIARTRTLILEA